MSARRLVLASLAALCTLACGLAAGIAPAGAVTQFGSPGSESEQLNVPVGVAVDATGNVYVGDLGNGRVDRFDQSGDFQLAWGWGVATGDFEELQTCTIIFCEAGLRIGADNLEFPSGVTVDDNPSSTSYGDVYVVDWSRARVEKFRPEEQLDGKVVMRFVLMFGGHVNKANGGNVCVAGEECASEGTKGTADGEFEYWPSNRHSFIAVGPAGRVYVGDEARVQVFEPSGVWRENVSLSGLSSKGRPTALAVNAGGDVYVADEGVPGVHEFEPDGTESAVFDPGSTSVSALAVDPSGDLFIGDSSGDFHVLEYGSTGNEVESFGDDTLRGENGGIAFSPIAGELYATEGSADSVWALPLPPPGPAVEKESATPGLRGAVTLEGVIDPENHETAYRLEYVDNASYQSSGFASATSTTSASIGSGFAAHSVTSELTGLVPGETYHYRVTAVDSAGHTTIGPDQAFTEIPAAYIESTWALNATSTSVTLGAEIDPLGASTTYRWEYGPTMSYGHVFSASAGEGMGFVPVSYHAQELEPDMTYHYRLVTTSEVGTVQGVDHTFTTQFAGGALTLPDGRVWELVSPANKKGVVIEPANLQLAANDGRTVAYVTHGPSLSETPAANNGEESYALSKRTPNGWATEDITPPRAQTVNGYNMFDLFGSLAGYKFFSSNLSSALLNPEGYGTPLLSPEATENTLYIRDNSDGVFLPLVTPTDVPPGTKFGGAVPGEGGVEPELDFKMDFEAATPDLSHVVLGSPLPLTPDGPPLVPKQACGPGKPEFSCANASPYEWSAGRLQLVSVLPNGEPVHEGPGAEIARNSARLNSREEGISSDGRWIVWEYGRSGFLEYRGLYVRDMFAHKTLEVGGSASHFQAMSTDGSKIFYSEDGALYVFETATGALTDLTPIVEPHTSVKEAVLGTSEDGSYVYFVGTGVFASGGVHGEDNVYVAHETGGSWKTEYVTTLSAEDEVDWFGQGVSGGVPPVARVSPDGRYLTFMSDRSLTGYDNVDAVSGQADEEVFLHDASTGRTVCVSCNPAGTRPIGAFDEPGSLLGDHAQIWRDRWLAANIPTTAGVQPRSVFDSGRVFFDSYDALVPQDTDGLADVYEYEPVGVGSCTSGSATFDGSSGGCVSLVSSGQSAGEAAFFDASENGDDAFFFTSSKLVPEDYDTAYDIYDAHVCSATAPCSTAAVSPPPCTSGDSCKAAPSPQPEIFGPAPSATFSGTGNVSALPVGAAIKPRSLTRAQKLARSLRACEKKHGGTRVACKRQARKRYRAEQSHSEHTTQKGNR